MKQIITEEMRFRQRVVKYAIKHNNNAEAARRYHTSRQQVWRWRKKYDGTVRSLANKSTRPHSHPNQHKPEELNLISKKYRYHGFEGLAQVYRKLRDSGYKRSYGSMCRQIKKLKLKKVKRKEKHNYPKSTYKPLRASYPGEYVQVDVKYVPRDCIGFKSHYTNYYQLTAIDLYTRKRVLSLENENSTFTSARFVEELEERMGFPIQLIQTDNGREFCNEPGQARSRFEQVLDRMKIKYKRTRPYSPWQNGVVERSHRIDHEKFYSRRRFKSEEEMYRSFKRYASRTNNIARCVLNFKTPNEVAEEYFEKKEKFFNGVPIE